MPSASDYPSPVTFLRWAQAAHVTATPDGDDVILTPDDGYRVPAWLKVHAERIKPHLVEELHRRANPTTADLDTGNAALRRVNHNVGYAFDLGKR